MSNSYLANYRCMSPNHSGPRTHRIDTVSIHCMAGNLTVEQCGRLFADSSRQASSNYGIGSDGRIALYVDEANRSWCTSSAANDNRAVTIEVANIEAREPYRISEAAYASLIKLLADICRRNGIPRLLWRADPGLLWQVDKQNMTVHRWFAAKSCPGDWLYEHHGQIAVDVNELLEDDEMVRWKTVQDVPAGYYRQQVERLMKEVQLDELVVTDSIPLRAGFDPAKLPFKLTQLSVAPLIGEAIRSTHLNESINDLFNHE